MLYDKLERLHESNPADDFRNTRLLHPAKVVVIRFQGENITSKIILKTLQCKVTTVSFLFERVPSGGGITEFLRGTQDRFEQGRSNTNTRGSELKQTGAYTFLTSIMTNTLGFIGIVVMQCHDLDTSSFEQIKHRLIISRPSCGIPIEILASHIMQRCSETGIVDHERLEKQRET